ncbi:MAG: hypothetical protein ABEH43_02655 [Flavobacteriales bacterium]
MQIALRYDKFLYFAISLISVLMGGVLSVKADDISPISPLQTSPDTSKDTSELKYPINDPQDPLDESNGIDLSDPTNKKTKINYNPKTGEYEFKDMLGDSVQLGSSSSVPKDKFLKDNIKKGVDDYWNQKENAEDMKQREGAKPELVLEEEDDNFNFGDLVDIRPQGSAELRLGLKITKTENPQIPENQRQFTSFEFDEKFQVNVTGSVADLIDLNIGFNTEANFDFENQINLKYEGKEDDIVKLIEAGNVSLPLQGSLIQGSQSLFGVKSKLQFGRLTVTTKRKAKRNTSTRRGSNKEF